MDRGTVRAADGPSASARHASTTKHFHAKAVVMLHAFCLTPVGSRAQAVPVAERSTRTQAAQTCVVP